MPLLFELYGWGTLYNLELMPFRQMINEHCQSLDVKQMHYCKTYSIFVLQFSQLWPLTVL